MKYIVDAQLPLRLKKWLTQYGHDALHTDDLPLKDRTPDIDIIKLTENEDRIVITKDSDFYKSNLLNGKPKRILMITTDNIINKDLIKLFELNFPTIETYFNSGSQIIELDNTSITIHS